MIQCLVIVVEGDTEIQFYKNLVNYIKEKNNIKHSNTRIEYLNVSGVGNFKSVALRKFVKNIKKKYKSNNIICNYTVFLCSDTDVFEFSKKPPVDWEEVKSDFLKNGANEVILIRAKRSIEDWFLYDLEGILSYLNLNKKTKVSGSTGEEKLKNLFLKANKSYIKGNKSHKFVEQLNFDKIIDKTEDELLPLIDMLIKDI